MSRKIATILELMVSTLIQKSLNWQATINHYRIHKTWACAGAASCIKYSGFGRIYMTSSFPHDGVAWCRARPHDHMKFLPRTTLTSAVDKGEHSTAVIVYNPKSCASLPIVLTMLHSWRNICKSRGYCSIIDWRSNKLFIQDWPADSNKLSNGNDNELRWWWKKRKKKN